MSNPFRDTGGKLPAGIGIIRNTTGQREHITTWDECREHLLKINRNPRYLKPIVKVRRVDWGYSKSTYKTWTWKCRLCHDNNRHATYPAAITQADRHARNHHRSQ